MSTPEYKIITTDETADISFSKKTLQDYEVVSVIGNGAFGTCFKVRDKESGKMYAWKGIDYDELSEAQKESLVSEIRVLRQLQHPNIVQYFHHLVNNESKSIFIVMEYCEGGDLSQLIAKAKAKGKCFEERYIWRILFQVCRALQVCHNKIQHGSILHRDIKPANIFLDMKGNAKLGDFGLARMLRHNENFAETFVGTPYYMSPEIIKGSKYDRKSDVWAVGCLTYEMCCLQPPFKGKEFNQLSANISIGKFGNIPDIYSKDLMNIISFMLEVENEQRPSIEIVSRHPLLVRNINDLGNHFPILIDTEIPHQDFCVENVACKNSEYSFLRDFSSTMFLEQNSFNESYGQRRLSISDVFTPDLRNELFFSAKREILKNSISHLSDPELYDSVQRDEYAIINETFKNSCFKQSSKKKKAANLNKPSQPEQLTYQVFDNILQERLLAIRSLESLLNHREENLNARERELNEREKRLIAFEKSLVEKSRLFQEECSKQIKSHITPSSSKGKLNTTLKQEIPKVSHFPPPVPPRISKKHNETYCSIEPNEISVLQQPTMAKLNMADLPAAKAFPKLRKVTFQSPNKLKTYDIESKTEKPAIRTTTSSKIVENFSESVATYSSSSTTSTTKRKSFFSIFGLSRHNKNSTRSTGLSASLSATDAKTTSTLAHQATKEPLRQPSSTVETPVISESQTSELNNIWTKKHKKAAFEMLAAMNAAEHSTQSYFNTAPRHKIRHSLRDGHSLQRTHRRHSVMVQTRLPNVHRKEQIVT